MDRLEESHSGDTSSNHPDACVQYANRTYDNRPWSLFQREQNFEGEPFIRSPTGLPRRPCCVAARGACHGPAGTSLGLRTRDHTRQTQYYVGISEDATTESPFITVIGSAAKASLLSANKAAANSLRFLVFSAEVITRIASASCETVAS